MKKIYMAIFISLLLIFGVLNVNAKTFTNKDVDFVLEELKDNQDLFPVPVGTTFSYETNDNETIITSTINGVSFTSKFTYNNGVYTFNSSLTKVSTSEELLKAAYEIYNFSYLLTRIYGIYDEEYKAALADVDSSDLSNANLLTLKDDGLSTTIIPIGIEGMENEGFIKTVSVDINHQKFAKMLKDGDGTIWLEIPIEKPAQCNEGDVVDFSVIINGGYPIIKGTPLNKIPIKIIEVLCDGSKRVKESNVGDSKDEIGYEVKDLDPNEEGKDKEATVDKVVPNPDGTRPETKKPPYSVIVDDSKDVVDFEVIINDGKPVIKGTPDDEVPIKITEKYKDGTTATKTSTIEDVEKDLGYRVQDFKTDEVGNFVANVSKVKPNSDGTVPKSRAAKYEVILGHTTIPNPDTGISSHIILIVVTMIGISGAILLKRKGMFKKL